MTLTQYKKIIKALNRSDLEDHLFSLFKTSKVFKDLEASTFGGEIENERLLEEYQSKLKRAFWKNSFSFSECKGVLKDYCSRTTDPRTIALMHLLFAIEAAELSAGYGDFGESFYIGLEGAAEKYLDYANTDLEFFAAHEDDFEKLIRISNEVGYGVEDNLVSLCVRIVVSDSKRLLW